MRAIYERDFQPQFSGHETFPLRYSWLKKVHDAVQARAADPENRLIFSAEDAISNFGVGKNMVTSMRYWALASRTLEENSDSKGAYRATALGQAVFGESNGWDPYIEHPATLWLIHWQLASNPLPTTTIFFVFNHFHSASFNRNQLLGEIQHYCNSIGSKVAEVTLVRDVDCFLRTYAVRTSSEEDSLDSLLAELALIRPIGKTDGFILTRGPKTTLPDAVFLYGLVSFARTRNNTSRTFSVESLLHEPGSPGRVFLLDEEALLERLSDIEALSGERISWSETAGLRQIIFQEDPNKFDLMKIAGSAYSRRRAAA